MAEKQIAAIIGGGVIGAGWAARFLLNGWDVALFDPDPESDRKVGQVLDNARRSLPGLYDVVLPPEGSIRRCETIAQAVDGASWIQESVPERIELKQKVYAGIQAAAPATAVIGSSTSGFKPSDLAEGSSRPGQILVTHPFNPVYLLPVVEVVPHSATDAATSATAMQVMTDIGMKPVLINHELDAHVADRLLEAVWREGLWMIKDGVVTTEELDDIMRYGFGIRWAQMGLFETYRVAGGEAGMRHFIAQFGPTLAFPWSKLMDVPELDEALIDRISEQSDRQSGMHSIRELERIRDNNLVAMMRALKGQNWGAGALLKEHDARLATQDAIDWSQPVTTISRAIPVDWTDYNGHMNEAHYLEVFGDATDRFMELVGCDAEYIATGGSYFTVETHIRHIDEVQEGARIYVLTQCLQGEGKKLHLFHTLHHEDDRILASGEHMLLHVSLETRRSSPPDEPVASMLATAMAGQSLLPKPEGAGRAIG